jgi:hypothetical protein
LNFRGEVVTLINTDEDVIQNPAVQEILQSLDGERTVVCDSAFLYIVLNSYLFLICCEWFLMFKGI